MQLVDIFDSAMIKWVQSYNSSPEKLLEFVDRYDETVSDSRYAIIKGPDRNTDMVG